MGSLHMHKQRIENVISSQIWFTGSCLLFGFVFLVKVGLWSIVFSLDPSLTS